MSLGLIADGPRSTHAIVIGGGVAGMCTARVLSRHFGQVTLIDRDALPTRAEHRPGVPQSHHVHALLLRGLLELETLFPGIESELATHGARRMDMGEEFAHFSEWGWTQRARIEVAPLTVSRLLLEHVVRTRVRGIDNVRVLDNTRVLGLLHETPNASARIRIVGVRTDRTDSPTLKADLVVDASGRSGKGQDWLDALGVPRPDEEIVDSYSGYASRFYSLSPSASRWWRGMLVDPKPPEFRRWGLLMPIEGNRHVLTLAGVNRDLPPTDEVGFHAYLASLRSPKLAQEIARATPLSDIRGFRGLANRARRYDSWQARVDGFIATGDSVVAFNAAHGQGMSMAAWCATTLDKTLHKVGSDPVRLPQAFHKAQWKVLRRAWDIAIGVDLQWPETTGKKPFLFGLMHKLAVAGTRAAHEDPKLKSSLGPVIQLLASPYSGLRPSVLSRVLLSSVRRRVRQPQALPANIAATLPGDTGSYGAVS